MQLPSANISPAHCAIQIYWQALLAADVHPTSQAQVEDKLLGQVIVLWIRKTFKIRPLSFMSLDAQQKKPGENVFLLN